MDTSDCLHGCAGTCTTLDCLLGCPVLVQLRIVYMVVRALVQLPIVYHLSQLGVLIPKVNKNILYEKDIGFEGNWWCKKQGNKVLSEGKM